MIKLQILQNLMQGRFRFAQFYQKTFQFILTHFKEAKIHFILNFVFIYNRVNMVKIAEKFFFVSFGVGEIIYELSIITTFSDKKICTRMSREVSNPRGQHNTPIYPTQNCE